MAPEQHEPDQDPRTVRPVCRTLEQARFFSARRLQLQRLPDRRVQHVQLRLSDRHPRREHHRDGHGPQGRLRLDGRVQEHEPPDLVLRTRQLRLRRPLSLLGEPPLRGFLEIRRQPQVGTLLRRVGRMAHLEGEIHEGRALGRRAETPRRLRRDGQRTLVALSLAPEICVRIARADRRQIRLHDSPAHERQSRPEMGGEARTERRTRFRAVRLPPVGFGRFLQPHHRRTAL